MNRKDLYANGKALHQVFIPIKGSCIPAIWMALNIHIPLPQFFCYELTTAEIVC